MTNQTTTAELPNWEALYEPGNVSTYLIGYANDQDAATGMAEAWMRSQAEVTGRLEWVDDERLATGRYDRWFELIECHGDGVDTGTGIVVRRRVADEPAPAAVSAAVAPPTQAAPSLRAGLRDEIVKALGRITTVPPVAHRREQADHVLAVLYREWPWLRAEAEDAEPTDRAAAEAALAAVETALGDTLVPAAREEALAGIAAALPTADRLRRMADETATETQRRCPFCDHEAKYHAADDGRCWFTVDHGAPGANLVCPCIPRDPGDDEPAAGARQDGAES